MHKCESSNGMVIKPDGVNELDPCIYEVVGKYANVTIEVLKCKNCGHVEISWYRQEGTEELEIE